MKNKPKCKCGARLYMRNGIPTHKLCPACRELKKQEKLAKHKLTKTGQGEEAKKLMRECDKLYQEIGRLKYKTCFFGKHTYNCLHHFVRKSQSLNTRYDFDNGIPICKECHCSIHQGQNSEIEARLVLTKGEQWLNQLSKRKHIIITDKLNFLRKAKEELESIKKSLLQKEAKKYQ